MRIISSAWLAALACSSGGSPSSARDAAGTGVSGTDGRAAGSGEHDSAGAGGSAEVSSGGPDASGDPGDPSADEPQADAASGDDAGPTKPSSHADAGVASLLPAVCQLDATISVCMGLPNPGCSGGASTSFWYDPQTGLCEAT